LLTKIILLSFCGSFLCLDRIYLQAMISRPIVIAPVMGFILNDPYTGLIIGALIELFWIDRVPIGTYIPPNDSVVAALAAAVAILAGENLHVRAPELMILAILCTIPFGIAAQKLEIFVIKSNDKLSDQALEDAKTGNIKAIERKNYAALVKAFLVILFYLLVLQLILVTVIVRVYPHLPPPFMHMLALVYYFMPLLGIAAALNTIKMRGAVPVFCAIFLSVAVAMEFFHVS
jgi:mannose PTS system EIIC component